MSLPKLAKQPVGLASFESLWDSPRLPAGVGLPAAAGGASTAFGASSVSTAGDGAGNCDLEIDDDGVQMWAADNDGSARDAGRVPSARARLREVSRGWRGP